MVGSKPSVFPQERSSAVLRELLWLMINLKVVGLALLERPKARMLPRGVATPSHTDSGIYIFFALGHSGSVL